ncbi:MAG: bifunctional riboflavin kinase/FAD synthetase [Deltaproteobacteria bacterium]|nr:bifunctional riboflavin kinase/FAD synthetase [Deltaproteobacteria bacterium]
MLVLRHLEHVERRFVAPVVTLGNFDGVHCGHQVILRRAVATAREQGGQTIAITFWPHPSAVLAPTHATALIMSLRQRIELIAACGVDVIIAQRFNQRFSNITAEDFVRRLVCGRLGAQRIVVGHRVSFGHARAGNAEVLRRLGAELDVGVEIVEPILAGDHLVSSSAVRRAIRTGHLELAQQLLGRPHTIAGRVIHGHHRGRSIGFPTANLRVRYAMVPPDGVYAVRVRHRGQWFAGIANIGFNPTFEDRTRSIEAHIFDFEESLYRQRLEVAFVRRLRGEQKFPTPQALAAQIERDVAAARAALAQA